MNFKDKLELIINKNNSLLCIGLDPEEEKLPRCINKLKNPICQFNKYIIDNTHDLVCAYKPNIAFYEALGLDGLLQLKLTISYLHKNYPDIPIVLDAKRGDIGNTAKMYAKAVFDFWQVDAVTVHSHLGYDSVAPFLTYKDKLTILLIKTSNPDSKMFQDIKTGKDKFYLGMARKIKKWPDKNIGVFVGATYPKELKEIRSIFPNNVFLSAGLGTQGGKAEEAIRAGIDKKGRGIMFNASRSILYASSEKDFAKRAREEAQKLRDKINSFRNRFL